MKRMFVPPAILFVLAFAIPIPLLINEQDFWAVIIFCMLILAAVFYAVTFTFRIARGNRRLARRTDAHRGTATVLKATELPVTMMLGGSEHQPRMFRLELRVDLPDEQPYEVTHYVATRPWDVDHIRPGRVIEARVHPRRRRKLALVFPEGTTRFGINEAGALGSIDPTVGAPFLNDPQVERLVRQSTGLDVNDLIRRAMAGEQVPGATVHFGHGSEQFGQVPGTTVAGGPLPLAPASASEPFQGAGPAIANATATVRGVQDLERPTVSGRLIELDLVVTRVGEPPYRVVIQADLPDAAIPRIGESIPVEIDPHRPSRVRLAR